jgi:hypothetical protein
MLLAGPVSGAKTLFDMAITDSGGCRVVTWNRFTLLKLEEQPGDPTLGCLRSLRHLKNLHIELGVLCLSYPPRDYCLASNLPPAPEVLELVAT